MKTIKKSLLLFISVVFLFTVVIYGTIPDSCLFWHKTENVTDPSEKGTNLTVLGSCLYETVKFNNGIGGSGSKARITFPLKSAFTTECWIKTKVDSSASFVYLFGAAITYDPCIDAFIFGGNLKISLVPASGATVYTFPISFTAGDIFHLAFVFDSLSAPYIKCYKDGVELSGSVVSGSGGWGTLEDPCYIDLYTGGDDCYNDNIKIFNYARTASEILASMNTEGFEASGRKFNPVDDQ